MSTASNAADELKKARQDEARTGGHPAAEARAQKIEEEQKAEFHGPATAVLDALQPFNVEGGEGEVHQMVARHAKTAAVQAVKDAGRHLLGAADIRPLVQKHPWLALGGAAAVGFAAAAMLVPSEKQRAASRLRALEQALDAEARGNRSASSSKSGSQLLRTVWRLVRPTLLSVVTSAITGAATGAASGAEAGADSGEETARRTTGMPPPPPGTDPDAADVT